MSADDVRLIATWSGKVHTARRGGKELVIGEVQAACSRTIYGFPFDADSRNRTYSRRQRKLREQYESTGRFERRDVCLNCASLLEKEGVL